MKKTFFIICLLCLLFSACFRKENEAPVLVKFLLNGKNNNTITISKTKTIYLEAIDKEGDEISYELNTDKGILKKISPQEYTFTAPDYPCTINLVLKLTDDLGNSSKYILEINVVENSAPIINGYKINFENVTKIEKNKIVKIFFEIEEPDDDEIEDSLSPKPKFGTIEKIDKFTFLYKAPQNECTENIEIKISDKLGNSRIENISFSIVSEFLREWAFLIYMAADNNLNGVDYSGYSENYDYAKMDLNEIANANIDSEKIGVLIYGDFKTDKSNLPGIYTKNTKKIEKIESLNEFNTGDKENLKKFIDYAKINMPSKKYILALWGHGTGWWDDIYKDRNNPKKSISYDETSYSDSLDLWELESAIKESKIPKFNIIYTDSCLMGTIEVAYQLKDIAEVVAFSPELTPGPGGDYKNILEYLNNNYNNNNLEIAKNIQEINFASYRKGGSQVNTDLEIYKEPVVYTVIDLKKFYETNIINYLNLICDKINVNYIYSIDTSKLLSYGDYSGDMNALTNNLDIAVFFKNIPFQSEELSKLINDFLTEYNKIIYYVSYQNGIDKGKTIYEDNSSGLSIFFPITKNYNTQNSYGIQNVIEEYKKSSKFALETKWTKLF